MTTPTPHESDLPGNSEEKPVGQSFPDRERGYYLPEELPRSPNEQNPDQNSKKRKLEDGEVETIEVQSTFNGHVSSNEGEDAKVIARLLGPFTREQIVSILISAAIQHENIYNEIKTIASADVAHRKLFVRGLSWDTTTASLQEFFKKFGKIEECTVVSDRNTGKSKGFGFVTFEVMEDADKVLQLQSLEIDGRKCCCNLAVKPETSSSQSKQSKQQQSSTAKQSNQQNNTKSSQSTQPPNIHGHIPTSSPHYPDAGPPGDESDRKLFVRGLDYTTQTEAVVFEFRKYGELEEVSIAKDRQTGKSKGFAFIVYRHQGGAQRALVQPQKTIDGRKTHCNLASQNQRGSQQPNTQSFAQQTPVPPMVAHSLPPPGVMPIATHPHTYVQAPYMGYQVQYSPEMYHMMPPQYPPMPPTQGYYHHPPPNNPPK